MLLWVAVGGAADHGSSTPNAVDRFATHSHPLFMRKSPQRPTNVRWAVFGLACGTSWLLYLHRYTFALIKPALVEDWKLDKVELGLLDSAFSISATLFQFPLGVAADWLGVRLVLTALILVWCLGLAM